MFIIFAFLLCSYYVRRINYTVLEPTAVLEYPQKREFIFSQQEEFNKFWEEYCKVFNSKGEKLPPPEIDFSKNMVIIVFSGEKPTSGYKIEIEKVEEHKNSIKVFVKEYPLKKDRIVMPVITYPYVIFKIKKVKKPIEFIYLKS